MLDHRINGAIEKCLKVNVPIDGVDAILDRGAKLWYHFPILLVQQVHSMHSHGFPWFPISTGPSDMTICQALAVWRFFHILFVPCHSSFGYCDNEAICPFPKSLAGLQLKMASSNDLVYVTTRDAHIVIVSSHYNRSNPLSALDHHHTAQLELDTSTIIVILSYSSISTHWLTGSSFLLSS